MKIQKIINSGNLNIIKLSFELFNILVYLEYWLKSFQDTENNNKSNNDYRIKYFAGNNKSVWALDKQNY